MGISEKYKLSVYQDYGALGEKANVNLVRNRNTGKICIKKFLRLEQKEIIEFRKNNLSSYFPKLFDVIEEADHYIIIEEYVEGITLEDYMMGEPLLAETARKFVCQICHALSLLHYSVPMIIYRDLKPENIMITAGNTVKLIDFNISRQYEDGKRRDTELLGTAAYAAPEQFGYLQTDNRTDIYALGVLFNYMLTGKLPGEYLTEGKYADVIRKCIELEPDKRYQSVDEILAVLTPKPTASKPTGLTSESIASEKPKPGSEYEDTSTVKPETHPLLDWLFKIPGFRNKNPKNILLAIAGYGLIFYLGFTMEFYTEDGTPYPLKRQWFNRIIMTLAQLGTVLFAGNYCGVSENIKIYRHHNKAVRILSYCLTWFIFLFGAVFLATLIETILF